MKDIFAKSFKSDLSLPEMFSRLNTAGPWPWIERDSDRFGDYLLGIALRSPQRGVLKIFAEPDHYAINVVLESDQPDARATFDSVTKTLFEQVLPTINAREIADTDDYE